VRGVGGGMDVSDGVVTSKGKGSFGSGFGASRNRWGICDALCSNYFEDLLFLEVMTNILF